MSASPTHKTPAAQAATSRPNRVGRWLADLGLGYVLMLTASIGGLTWLTATHLLGIRHDAALILALAAGAGALARAHQLAARAVGEHLKDKPEVSDEPS